MESSVYNAMSHYTFTANAIPVAAGAVVKHTSSKFSQCTKEVEGIHLLFFIGKASQKVEMAGSLISDPFRCNHLRLVLH